MTKRIDDVRRAAEKDLANIKQTLQFAQNKVKDFRVRPVEDFSSCGIGKQKCLGGGRLDFTRINFEILP